MKEPEDVIAQVGPETGLPIRAIRPETEEETILPECPGGMPQTYFGD